MFIAIQILDHAETERKWIIPLQHLQKKNYNINYQQFSTVFFQVWHFLLKIDI